MKESQILEFEKGTHVRIEEADDGDDDDGANGYARSDHSFLCSSLSPFGEKLLLSTIPDFFSVLVWRNRNQKSLKASTISTFLAKTLAYLLPWRDHAFSGRHVSVCLRIQCFCPVDCDVQSRVTEKKKSTRSFRGHAYWQL